MGGRVSPLALSVVLVAATAAEAPTIVVDAAHNQIVQREATKPPAYVVAPRASVRLDARNFDFSKAGYPNLRPNAVRVVLKRHQYFADWDGTGVFEMSPDTLVPQNDAPKFPGFVKGDSVEVNLGKKDVDHARRSISFKVQWAAHVRVRAR